MNYFIYQTNTTGKVWSLFRELGESSPEQREKMYAGSDYAHTLEMVSAALNGSINMDAEAVESFNLWGYEAKCAETDALNRRSRAKKVLNIVEFSTSSEDSLEVGYGDVSARDLSVDDGTLEDLVDSIAFEENLRKLFNIRSRYICERGVDIVSVLYGALKGIPDAINEMKSLVKDSVLSDIYTQLCEESQDGMLLRRLEMAV